jgi:hypothetical protein
MLVSILMTISILVNSCSPEQRKDWHVRKLDKLKKHNPGLFKRDSIVLDSVIKAKVAKLELKLRHELDSVMLKEAETKAKFFAAQAHLAKLDLIEKGITDCDTVIKYLEGETKWRVREKEVYKNGKCTFDPIVFDSGGLHVKAYLDTNGKGRIYVKNDSTHVKLKGYYDCPTVPKSWFWEFVFMCVIVGLFIMYMIRGRR